VEESREAEKGRRIPKRIRIARGSAALNASHLHSAVALAAQRTANMNDADSCTRARGMLINRLSRRMLTTRYIYTCGAHARVRDFPRIGKSMQAGFESDRESCHVPVMKIQHTTIPKNISLLSYIFLYTYKYPNKMPNVTFYSRNKRPAKERNVANSRTLNAKSGASFFCFLFFFVSFLIRGTG